MMDTPICDFVRRYAERESLRLHMPGHKGRGPLGFESLDITEIDGADSLYEADGIIRQSEENASALFASRTFYSTEGSSQCIRAMLYLAVMYARSNGVKPVIAAGRNAHKTFLSATALLDIDVLWLYPEKQDSYLSCIFSAEYLDAVLSSAQEIPTAVYLTSPDYLGNVADVRAISEVCRRYGVLLIVDNAHGAYLKFLPESRHPIDLGADMCCDSAHKTLPVLTGGAYLHISDSADEKLALDAKNALALFGSTSPSYLILQSLDKTNEYLSSGYKERLCEYISKVQTLKKKLSDNGYCLQGDEPLKITVRTKPYGYDGRVFSKLLSESGIVCEFSDPDHIVFMLTPETGSDGLECLEKAMLAVEKKEAITLSPPQFHMPQRVMSVRQAVFSPSETVAAKDSVGRVLAVSSVGCPPAVPIVVCGERIDEDAVRCFEYYGITTCSVVI